MSFDGSGGTGGLLRRAQDLSPQLRLVLVISFLNAFKYFTLATALSIFATNEYGISDAEASNLYGIWGLAHTIWGFIGSFAVDYVGLKAVGVVAATLGVFSRGLLVFTKSKANLYLVLLLFGPFAEGVFDPLLSVAIKKMTRRRERAFAFSVKYAFINLGGAVGLHLMDALRSRTWVLPVVGAWSGLRLTLFTTWVSAVLSWFLVFFLREPTLSIGPFDNPEAMHWSPGLEVNAYNQQPAAGYVALLHPSPASSPPATWPQQVETDEDDDDSSTEIQMHIDETDTSTWPSPDQGPAHQQVVAGLLAGKKRKSVSDDSSIDKPNSLVRKLYREVSAYVLDAAFQRAVIFTSAVLFVSMQWRFMDTLMPKFVERVISEKCPWGSIYSINSWMCVLLPPLLSSSFLDRAEDFSVIIPGLWIMALSPLCISVSISEIGTAMWVFTLSLGEVLWSPRSQSYIASLAPHGREGAFLALAGFPTFFSQYPVGIISGVLLDDFCPACPQLHNTRCSRDHSWSANPAAMWFWVSAMSIASPFLVSCMIKYFRYSVSLMGHDPDDY